MKDELFDLHARGEQSHWWFVARREIVGSLLRKLLPPSPRPLVVDIGCGTGANIGEFTSWSQAVGIDTSERAIALAEERFPNVHFIHGFAPDDLGATAHEADAFLIMDVLEHVENDCTLLSAIVAGARPGAYVVVTVPADMALWSEHDVSFGHFRRYTASDLRALWAALPVETLLISYFNSRLYPLIRAARTIGRRLRIQWGREKTDLGEPWALVNRTLRSVFRGEAVRLHRVLAGTATPYSRGVSLIAILRRQAEPAATGMGSETTGSLPASSPQLA